MKFHPGEYLKDELEARKLPVRMMARMSGLSADQINNIINEKENITPEIAQGISRALGTSAETWLKLQKSFDG